MRVGEEMPSVQISGSQFGGNKKVRKRKFSCKWITTEEQSVANVCIHEERNTHNTFSEARLFKYLIFFGRTKRDETSTC
jgi:hypothetical protein